VATAGTGVFTELSTASYQSLYWSPQLINSVLNSQYISPDDNSNGVILRYYNLLSDLPAGSKVISATMTINYNDDPSPGGYNEIPMNAMLTVGAITNSYAVPNDPTGQTGVPFATPNIDNTTLATLSCNMQGSQTVDVTGIVQNWATGTVANYGVLVDSANDTWRRIHAGAPLYGDPSTNLTITYQPGLPGDINEDGLVDVADYNIWAANVGKTGATWQQGDLNGDGLVDVADYNIWAANVGKTSATPEPISMIILAIGGGFVALRRNRA
jgi:hypothetical protein